MATKLSENMSKLIHRMGREMELLLISYLKGNELWSIGGWHWLEQRLMYRERMSLRSIDKRAGWLVWSDVCFLCLCFQWFYLGSSCS